MKPLIKFALYLAWFWLKWLPCLALYYAIGINGNEAERVQMESDLVRLHTYEEKCEAYYG